QADSQEQANLGYNLVPNLTVKEALRRAAQRVEGRFQDQPVVEASVRQAIGNAYRGIGAAKDGVPHLERALALLRARHDPGHPELLSHRNTLALAYLMAGRPRDALPHLAAVLDTMKAQGVANKTTLAVANNFALAHQGLGQFAEAVSLHEQVLAIF